MQVKKPGKRLKMREKVLKEYVRKREVLRMQAVRVICLWHWAGVFGAPAGGREGTWFSPVVPAAAPVPTQNQLKLAHILTHLFIVE